MNERIMQLLAQVEAEGAEFCIEVPAGVARRDLGADIAPEIDDATWMVFTSKGWAVRDSGKEN